MKVIENKLANMYTIVDFFCTKIKQRLYPVQSTLVRKLSIDNLVTKFKFSSTIQISRHRTSFAKFTLYPSFSKF
jgi:hypothetical protein